MTTDEELWVKQRDVDRARQAFRAKCRAILRQAYEDADQVSAAVGLDGTVNEVYQAWVLHLIQTLEQERMKFLRGVGIDVS